MKTRFSFILIGFWSTCISSWAQTPTKLLPFQGYLSTAEGVAVADGAKVVQFKIYDAPVSGTAVWAGEVHKLSVNKGLVNTVLGTKTAFPERYASNTKLMFSEPLFVEITIDADNSQTIDAADPPLLPRQVLLPANFAHQAMSAVEADHATLATTADVALNAQKVQGQTLLNVSTGALKPEFIAAGSIPASAIVANDGISKHQLATDSVTNDELAQESVDIGNLVGRRGTPSPNAGFGEIAVGGVSGTGGVHTITTTTAETISTPISLTSTGRPVRIELVPAGAAAAWVDYISSGTSGEEGILKLFRNGAVDTSYQIRMVPRGTNSVSALPASIAFIDFPPFGNYTYTLRGSLAASGGAIRVIGCKLVAYEF